MEPLVIQIARKEIGTKETPPDSNKVKYNDWFYNGPDYGKSAAWCGTFVSWCYDQAKMKLGTIDYLRGFAGCQYAVNNIHKWGKQVTVPQSGDIVFFDWNGDGRFDHTGLFVKDNGKGLFQTIEGNTSYGNDSNGGEVMLRERKYKNAIFARPNSLKITV
jgi:hypothetical protein